MYTLPARETKIKSSVKKYNHEKVANVPKVDEVPGIVDRIVTQMNQANLGTLLAHRIIEEVQ